MDIEYCKFCGKAAEHKLTNDSNIVWVCSSCYSKRREQFKKNKEKLTFTNIDLIKEAKK